MSDDTDSLRQRLEERSTEELLEIVRAHDTDEWLPEVFPLAEEILRSRGVDVSTEADETDDAEATSPDDPFVAIAGFATVVESEACRSALTAAGFTVAGADKFLLQVDPALGPALGGFRLGVPASQAEDARQFLAAAETGELSEGLLECPACGSTEVDAQKDSTRSGTLVNTLLVGPVVRDVTVSFRCRACGEKFE
jgi:hypothetical protein